MFNLFPKHWFKRSDPMERQRAMAVNNIQSKWRESLANTLSRVLGNSQKSHVESVEQLEHLNGSTLLKLDQLMRASWESDTGWPRRGNIPLVRIQARTDEVCAYLFCASCNINGFIRQQALIEFVHYPGRLAVAAALIRSDDWVPQVRQSALDLLNTLISQGHGAILFDIFDLVGCLEHRSRAAELLSPRLESVLCAVENRELRWLATSKGSPQSRLLAWQLVLRADLDRLQEAVERALFDPHPTIARWAFTTIDSHSIAPNAKLLSVALKHRHCGIRSEAVRRYAKVESENLRPILEAALFDRVASVRNAAATELAARFSVSALTVWRSAIKSQNKLRAYIGLIALCEHAEVADIPVCITQFPKSKSLARVAILRALWRLRAPSLSSIQEQALIDSSSCVVRQAVAIYARGGEVPDARLLDRALKLASTNGARKSLLGAAHYLGKWESLHFLLNVATTFDDDHWPMVSHELGVWLASCNRRFTTLPSMLLDPINASLQLAASQRPHFDWANFQQLLPRE